jgi:Holliday junction resolvase RusA-like endonuclease
MTTKPIQIRLTLSLPDPYLFHNKKAHWGKKLRLAKRQKGDAALVALNFFNSNGLEPPRWKEATIDIRVFKRSGRAIDRDNFLNAMKSAWDGLEKAGVVENDSGFWHMPPIFEVDAKNPRVELIITERIEK